MEEKWTTRRDFLKAACGLGLVVLADPFVASCSGGGRTTPAYSRTINEVTAYIDEQVARGNVKGLSVALVDDERVVWAQGFGYADVANSVPATADTHFEIGSNSKTFTGVMIAQLVERGLLGIDDAITRHVPSFRIGDPLGFPAGRSVTIRTMMTDYSGIPGDIFNGGFTFGVPRPDMNRWLLNYLVNDNLAYPCDFVPAYSNTAVALLGDVIASASRTSFASYSEALFDTLGMDRSSFDPTSPKVTDHMSKGYKGGQETGPFYCNAGTAGSIISTANDMAKYLKMIMAGGMGERGRVMQPATVEMMLTRQPSSPLDFFDRGFLWSLSAWGLNYAGRACSHDGATVTMSSYMVVLRDHKLAAVVLSNTCEAAGIVGNTVIKTLQLALQEKTGIAPPPPFAPAYSPPAAWPQAILDAMSGIYVKADTQGGYVKINSVAGGLEWTDNGNPVRVIPRQNGWLSAADSQVMQYEFRAISGRNTVLYHTVDPVMGSATAIYADKYSPVAVPGSWNPPRLGSWAAIDLDPADFQLHISGGGNPTLELSIADGMLILRSNSLVSGGSFVIEIDPADDTRGYVKGLGRRGGTAVKVVTTGAGEEIQFFGVRYRKR